jgi:outer membrane lipoprotein-sorting protein
MMPPLVRWSWSPVFFALMLVVAGCNSPTKVDEADEAAEASTTQDGMTAKQIVERMVEVYRAANTYMDSAVFGPHFVRAEDGVKRQGVPINVAVLWKRPNRFRITRIEPTADGTDMAAAAVVVSDGTQLEGAVSWLEPQRLRLPAPEVATLETVAPDPLLAKALFPVAMQDIFPQLALLLTPKDQTPWPLATPSKLVLLPTKEIKSQDQSVPCYRVQMPTSVGPQVLWIAKESFLLLRVEITNEELQKQLYPHDDFNKFVWQFDFYDVQVNAPASRDLFRLTSAEDGVEPRVVTVFEEIEATETSDSSDEDPAQVANDEQTSGEQASNAAEAGNATPDTPDDN